MMNRTSSKRANRLPLRAYTLISVVVGTFVLTVVGVALTQQANSFRDTLAESNRNLADRSFSSYQAQIANTGAEPATMSRNTMPSIGETTETIPGGGTQTMTDSQRQAAWADSWRITTTSTAAIYTWSNSTTPLPDGFTSPVAIGRNRPGPVMPSNWYPSGYGPVSEPTTRTVQVGMPSLAHRAAASVNNPGFAEVRAFAASEPVPTAGYRIRTSAAAETAVAIPLNPPVFNYSGLVSEATFSSNPTLQGFLAPANNPSGSFVRYTTDGTDPSLTNGLLWSSSSSFPAYLPPQQVRAAAFHSDTTQWSRSAIVTGNFSRVLSVAYSRQGALSPSPRDQMGFAYREVRLSQNPIVLNLPNGVPSGTLIYYTVDGSNPTSTSLLYTGPFHVPLAFWSPAGAVLRVRIFTTEANITGQDQTFNLLPYIENLPPPSVGSVQVVSSENRLPVGLPATFSQVANILVQMGSQTQTVAPGGYAVLRP